MFKTVSIMPGMETWRRIDRDQKGFRIAECFSGSGFNS